MGDSVITFLTHYSNEQNYHFRFPYSAQQKIDFKAVSDEQNIDKIITYLYPSLKLTILGKKTRIARSVTQKSYRRSFWIKNKLLFP